MTHDITTCEYCSNVSHNFDIIQVLQLSISSKMNKLNECMDNFIRKERMDKINKIMCNFCGKKNRSIKQILLWKTPKILIIELKRFKFDMNEKINNMIEYPIINFNISKYIDPLSPFINDCNYKLFAVNSHHGKTINHGHYTTTVLNRYNNKWYEYNDSHKLIKKSLDELVTNNAYMLFYYRDK